MMNFNVQHFRIWTTSVINICIRSYCLSSELYIATALETQEQAKKILKTNCTHTFYPRWSVSHILHLRLRLRFWIVFVYIKRILLNRAFVISRFCSIHWIIILAGLKKIVSYISIGNSMSCSDVWHKYHEWYFKIVIRNFTSR